MSAAAIEAGRRVLRQGAEALEQQAGALGEDFAFEKGSATLNKEGKKSIEKLALKLNDGDHANQMVVVEGHTDDAPVSRPQTVDKFTDNWGLSAARSASGTWVADRFDAPR